MIGQVLVPVTVFTALVLALTVLVHIARLKLEPSGTVSLDLGSGRSVEVPAGELVLFALAEHGIYLPAACGGRGSCGQCRVTVTEGARPLLPTEALHIDAAAAAAGVRLACRLKALGPMALRLESDVLTARKIAAVVESARSLTPYLRELVLVPDAPLEFEAGDYVLVEASPHRLEFSQFDIDARFRQLWEENGFLHLKSRCRETTIRAYSLASPPSEPERLVLVIRIALPPPTAPAGTPPGCVSSYLFGLKPGDPVSLKGPFGDFHVQESGREMVFIGGGAGIAPLRSMILDQLGKGTERRISLWYGARNIDELCYIDELMEAAERHENFSCHVALSSAGELREWQGYTGFIHSVVQEHYLRDHPAPESVEYYLCGPPLMSAATLQMLESLGVPRKNVLFDDFGA